MSMRYPIYYALFMALQTGTNLGNYQQINIKGTSKRNKENVYAQFSHKRKWNLVICINIIEFNKNTLYEKRQINIAHKNEF